MFSMLRRCFQPKPVPKVLSPEEQRRLRFEDFYAYLSPEVAAMAGDMEEGYRWFCALEGADPHVLRQKMNDPNNKSEFIDIPAPAVCH